jgi:hypothetical protein
MFNYFYYTVLLPMTVTSYRDVKPG